jgi:pSer/pThr/pTyr-binding forkhead associated (FHA) protein
MPGYPLHRSSAPELRERLEAERTGLPFLLFRTPQDEQRIVLLGEHRDRLVLGRGEDADLRLAWDGEISRVHAFLDRVGDEWTLVDDGLSRNGSFVNGERIHGRRRLEHGDDLRLGETTLTFLHPDARGGGSTITAAERAAALGLSDTQRRVLLALARPFKDATAFTVPATNREIAEALYLSQDAVKGHLRALFRKFGVDDLQQNAKRAALVERALATGAITRREL